MRKARFTVTITEDASSMMNLQAVEDIFARIAARVYAAEHPELFGRERGRKDSSHVAGSAVTVATVTSAPLENTTGPALPWSVEQSETESQRRERVP